ncbi:Type I secretion system protein TolC [Colwellia sp. MT41]|uniref:Type I secretion system protein TolC n=1 Tax=Colwellia sp. MT41 TaxID=58049 RepID=UPI0009FA0806|nr:Type I secretion system protein TolC [Colwellia sp. MT41]
MATPRKQQISLVDTPYYHCLSRCVRWEFLCGEDKITGQSHGHRRGWDADKLHTLSGVFP